MGFYLFLIVFVVAAWKRISTRWIRYSTLVLVAGIYFAPYVPDLYAFREYSVWKSTHPDLQQFSKYKREKIASVYLPHLSCLELCKELLINGNVGFVETKNTGFVKSVSGERISIGTPFTRWRIVRSQSTCWSLSQNELPSINFDHGKGLLAQGVCFILEPAQTNKSDLIVSVSHGRQLSGGSRYLSNETTIYKAQIITKDGYSEAWVANYRAMTRLRFPLSPYIHIYYGSMELRVARRKISSGPPSLEAAFSLAGLFERDIKVTRARPLLRETNRKLMEEAAGSKNPLVRWSLTHALCLLDEIQPGSMDDLINRLKSDHIAVVARSANKAVLHHKSPCETFKTYPQSVRILQDGTRIPVRDGKMRKWNRTKGTFE